MTTLQTLGYLAVTGLRPDCSRISTCALVKNGIKRVVNDNALL